MLGFVFLSGMLFVATCIAALPGFAVLRFGLSWLGRSDWQSFCLAGFLNGAALTMFVWGPHRTSLNLFVEYPPSPIFLVVGTAAGLVTWAAERSMVRA